MIQQPRHPPLGRRVLLRAVASMGGAAILAACGGGKKSSASPSAASTGSAAPNNSANNIGSSNGLAPSSPGAQPANNAAAATAGGVASGSAATGNGANAKPARVIGAATIPQPMPTQGGGQPTIVGAAASQGTGANGIPQVVQGTTQFQQTPIAGSAAASTPGSSSAPVGTVGAASASAGTPQPAARVTITADRKLNPPQVTINRGQVVQFVNASRSPQVLTTDPNSAADKSHAASPNGATPWDSGVLNPGQAFTQTFTTPGDYTYFSIPGEAQGIVGHITVTG